MLFKTYVLRWALQLCHVEIFRCLNNMRATDVLRHTVPAKVIPVNTSWESAFGCEDFFPAVGGILAQIFEQSKLLLISVSWGHWGSSRLPSTGFVLNDFEPQILFGHRWAYHCALIGSLAQLYLGFLLWEWKGHGVRTPSAIQKSL